MRPPTPPPPHSRPASRRLCCSDRAGSDEIAVGNGSKGLGGPGLRDPLQGLKALFLRKLEKWWRKIAHKHAIPPPPTTDSAAITVLPRLRPARGTSPSTVESSDGEIEDFVAVARGRRGEGQGERAQGQKRNLFRRSTHRRGTRDSWNGHRRRCRRHRDKRGSWCPGRWTVITITIRDQRRGHSPRWPPGLQLPSARGKNQRGELELRTPTE
jgi:hypothetical protein